MAKLIYCGPEVAPGGGIPLPEGWPMAAHEEPDEVLATAKVESGNYRYANPPKPVKEAEAPKHNSAGVPSLKEGDD